MGPFTVFNKFFQRTVLRQPVLNQCKYCSSTSTFKVNKILVLTKISRYEFEKQKHKHLTEKQLEKKLRGRGSDYDLILYHHHIHKGIESKVVEALKSFNFETKLVNRLQYTDDLVNWADCVVATGGDGTFLLAATRIKDSKKTLIGINSDPIRSKGHLCLPSKYSVNVESAIQKLMSGKFSWKFRNRIRTTLFGKDVYSPPIELHKQELEVFENRYLDIDPELYHKKDDESCNNTRVLPFLALNEVFIGENVSGRVSYLELKLEDMQSFKQKCSGFVASTGTGSTSWAYNINRLTEQTMEDILAIVKENTGLPLKVNEEDFVKKLTEKFNETLILDSAEPRMVFIIRDMLPSMSSKPRGFAREISVQSRCFDAGLVIDGGVSYAFNDGTRAVLEMRNCDRLRTVTLHEEPDDIFYKH